MTFQIKLLKLEILFYKNCVTIGFIGSWLDWQCNLAQFLDGFEIHDSQHFSDLWKLRTARFQTLLSSQFCIVSTVCLISFNVFLHCFWHIEHVINCSPEFFLHSREIIVFYDSHLKDFCEDVSLIDLKVIKSYEETLFLSVTRRKQQRFFGSHWCETPFRLFV